MSTACVLTNTNEVDIRIKFNLSGQIVLKKVIDMYPAVYVVNMLTCMICNL